MFTVSFIHVLTNRYDYIYNTVLLKFQYIYHAVLFFWHIFMYILVDFANKSVFPYIVILGLYEFFKFK